MASDKSKIDLTRLDEELLSCFMKIVSLQDNPVRSLDQTKQNESAVKLVRQSCRSHQAKCVEESNRVKYKLEEKCSTLLHDEQKLQSRKDETSVRIVKFYANLREEINNLLKREEQRFHDQLTAMAKTEEQEIVDKVSNCRSLLKVFEENEHLLDHLHIDDTTTQDHCSELNSAFDKLNSQLHNIDQNMSKFDATYQVFEFVPDIARKDKLLASCYATWSRDHSQDIGGSDRPVDLPELSNYPGEEVDPRSPGPYRPRSLLEHNRQTFSQESEYDERDAPANESEPYRYADRISAFDTTVPGDKRKAKVGGICWVNDRILVCDQYNRKLKIFNENGEILFAMLFPEGEPWDVCPGFQEFCPIRTECCFMTIPGCKQLVRVRVGNDDKLELVDRLRTQVGYSCLAYNLKNATIIAGCGSLFGRPRVDTLSIKGDILLSFALDSDQKQLFDFPRSANISDDGVITVCDWGKNRILYLNNQGYIFGTYKGTREYPLRDPRGTTLDLKGHLMIADAKSHSVHITDLRGRFVGTLRVDKPIEDPQEIDINTTGDQPKLAVSYRGHHVKVYNLSL